MNRPQEDIWSKPKFFFNSFLNYLDNVTNIMITLTKCSLSNLQLLFNFLVSLILFMVEVFDWYPCIRIYWWHDVIAVDRLQMDSYTFKIFLPGLVRDWNMNTIHLLMQKHTKMQKLQQKKWIENKTMLIASLWCFPFPLLLKYCLQYCYTVVVGFDFCFIEDHQYWKEHTYS